MNLANNTDIILHFKRLLFAQSYLLRHCHSVIIHVQLCEHSWYKQPQKRRLVASIRSI